jgi:hypothetical protein
MDFSEHPFKISYRPPILPKADFTIIFQVKKIYSSRFWMKPVKFGKDYALACLGPRDIEGLTIVEARHPSDKRELENTSDVEVPDTGII